MSDIEQELLNVVEHKTLEEHAAVQLILNTVTFDLDEIDNKPWRVFRQLAKLMPEYADIYTEYEAFYAYGGGNKVRALIDKFKKTKDYKESGFPEKIENLMKEEKN